MKSARDMFTEIVNATKKNLIVEVKFKGNPTPVALLKDKFDYVKGEKFDYLEIKGESTKFYNMNRVEFFEIKNSPE